MLSGYVTLMKEPKVIAAAIADAPGVVVTSQVPYEKFISS